MKIPNDTPLCHLRPVPACRESLLELAEPPAMVPSSAANFTKKNWRFEQPERGINHDRCFMFQWPQLNEPSGSQLPTFNSNTHLYIHPEHPSRGCPSKREKSNASSKFPLNKNCTFGHIITPFAGNPGDPLWEKLRGRAWYTICHHFPLVCSTAVCPSDHQPTSWKS